MAFCTFDDSAALFDSTPVENMFITEYMLRAPGDFVKVYLYALMLCYHNAERMSLTTMAKDLDMTEEEVERAFKYWARQGLVRQVGDQPVRYTLYNLKQITLTRAQTPSEQLYNRDFVEEINRVLDAQTVSSADLQKIFDWVDVLELPEEVVLMLLETEKQSSRTGRVSIAIADKVAHQWAQGGVKTVEDVEKIVIIGRERENQLRKLLARLGQRRTPSDDEKAMYTKWLDDWGFTPDAVQEACRETTKGTPTMAYLDGILNRMHQSVTLENLEAHKKLVSFCKKVFKALGRVNTFPSDEDQVQIDSWIKAGFSEEMIMMAATEVHAKNLGGNLEYIQEKLNTWRDNQFMTAEEVKQARKEVIYLNKQLREIYAALGLVEKRANPDDRKLLIRWSTEYGFRKELILLAAEYASKSRRRMETVDRILSDWQRAGIATVEAARREHEAHIKGAPQSAGQTAHAAQDTMLRYTPEQRRETYSAAVLDFDEEDN